MPRGFCKSLIRKRTHTAMMIRHAVCLAIMIAAAAGGAEPEGVTLIRDGACRAAIYVAPEVMEGKEHVRVRESVKDLARYLGAMTGTTLPVHARPPQAGEAAIPILIGNYADAVFGPFAMRSDFKQGFRLVVSARGVGMQGETDDGISYAIYELLDALGCRWYLPGELGEVIRRLPAITLPAMDRQQAPGTVSRNIWYADADFKRRNRLSGFPYTASHALEGYIAKEQLAQHPEWQAQRNGKRDLYRCDVGHHLCWGNPEVSDAIADRIIASLDKAFTPCFSLSPGDYYLGFCECEKCKALDAGDWDVTLDAPALTDRYLNVANRIAARVTTRHPGVKFGFLVYSTYTRPPLREKVHPSLIPQIAPITYCRAHTLDDPTCESRRRVRDILEGWGKAARHIAMYEYYYHLAETAAPFPMIKRNVVELPVQYANHVTMWTPETMANFETALPGMHLGLRMAWDPTADPLAILTDFHAGFYGAAVQEMRAYWEYIDDLWTAVPEHAGCGFGYMRRFTREALAGARAKMDAALAACQTAMEYRRVKLADDSLRQHELFMKIRRDYFVGRSATLEADIARWRTMHQVLAEQYRANAAFTDAPRSGGVPMAVAYFDWFYIKSYQDLARIARDYTVLTPTPVNVWRYAQDAEKQGEALGWHQADFDDGAWPTTDVAMDTWAALGLMDYYRSVWYRATVKAPAVPADKKIYLWVGATDGACKLFVNGTHVPFVNAKGEPVAEANGSCMPFTFDVTAAVRSATDNQITLIGTRNFINELGTGGLMGPVLLVREK